MGFLGIPIFVIVVCSLIVYNYRERLPEQAMMNWPRNWWKRAPLDDRLEKLAWRLGCSKEEVLQRALMLIELAAEEGTHLAVLDRKQHVRLIISSLEDEKRK